VLGIHKLLIIYCDYGRLGNRLHTHANALAWCIENKYNLINLSFNEYAGLFKNSSMHKSGNLQQTNSFLFKSFSSRLFRNFLRRLLLSDKWLARLAWIIKQIKPSVNEVLQESDLNLQINHKKINLVKYWDVSCTNFLHIHENKLKDYLRPNERFAVAAEKIIDELKSKYDCLIGVHARRGDYATYLDGIHYHAWESYLQWVNQTKQLLEKLGKKNVGIVLCSDEVPPSTVSNIKGIYFNSNNEVMVDIHILTHCDYNLGPPSSFGTWISWFGKVPRLQLEKGVNVNSISQFLVCTQC
jgi:hypothetical protein